ncbi:RNA-binding transcriptional accessory protein [Psychromonas sp. B3M02]|uniref:Tex-like N-terminal domain-containing protein n=1 Tax=Psychromonas sp. B3M02 TaxID=2267226 RepID=UPI000DEA29AC|nr:Tex family protein [Psychromonas sp. B3M02]RBW47258.1 RNA-binding transcriptional accessory protein [Psychromonas sp. B3M02]
MPLSANQLIDDLASACKIKPSQVKSAIELLDDGNTVPFIARYRKHLTESLDDTQLRLLESKLIYFRELASRKESIVKAIAQQGKLTSALKREIESIKDKVTLEHCYAPFKTSRVTKAKLAEEAGLAALAEQLWQSPKQDTSWLAGRFINVAKGFESKDKVIEGALAIAIDKITQDVKLQGLLKAHLVEQAELTATVVKSKIDEAIKFKDYFDFKARLNRLPAHRVLAMLRGKAEGFLRLKINADPFQKDKKAYSYCQTIIAKQLGIYLDKQDHDSWHRYVIENAWRTKLLPSLEKQCLVQLKEQADDEAIEQFANNLKALLMASPAGAKVTLGLDPGFRSGCKLAVVDQTGKLLATETIYPHQPQAQSDKATQVVSRLIKHYKVELIAIGNGTASRESEQFIANIIKDLPVAIQAISVSEAGASVYSASALAAQEFPQLDVTLRGAVSIARRLQDPLSELVKIEAKAIGVGLYQHDVNQTALANRLQAVVEDCVNNVGVDLNTASSCVLAHVAGLNVTLATNIVAYREENGRFNSRQALNKVPRLGAKAFQQAAGFLRVVGGDNCLDQTILHPEQYPQAKQLAAYNKQTLTKIVVEKQTTNLNLPPANDAQTVEQYKAILATLTLARLDPREEFKTADFAQSINKIGDLEEEMELQGVVTNVANFGAFVDIGVHQDGLVHISMLADRFVDDPHKVVKVGQIVNVKVVSVEVQRKRIALTMKQVTQPNS